METTETTDYFLSESMLTAAERVFRDKVREFVDRECMSTSADQFDKATFPMKLIPTDLIVVELGREFFSIVMLIAVAAVAAKKFWERFGWFIIMFGVWDIFYYIWLKVAIGWPSSLLDWDLALLIVD